MTDAAPADIAAQIRAEQVAQLYRGSPIAFALEPLAAGLLVFDLWTQMPHHGLALWLIAAWTLIAVRIVLWHRFHRARARPGTTDRLVWLYLPLALLAGCVWGATGFALWPQASAQDRMTLILALGAVTAADSAAMASFMPAVVARLAGTVAVMLAALLWSGEVTLLMTAWAVFFVATLAIGARYVNRLLANGLRLRFELAAAGAAAQAANVAKSEFIANMSHELRTPLNAVIGFSEVIKDQMFGPAGNPRYLQYARDIHHSGTHLLDIINDILDLSKIESGKMELKEGRVEVPTAVASALSLLRDRAEAAGVALEVQVAANLPTVWVDERAMRQILLNLLSNAIKFTPIGGTVTVEARLDQHGGLLLAVRDNGIGMAAADIPKALEAFGQLESAYTRKNPGTGLGLPLVKSLVELHDGRMELRSQPAVGTVVEVWLPAERVLEAA